MFLGLAAELYEVKSIKGKKKTRMNFYNVEF